MPGLRWNLKDALDWSREHQKPCSAGGNPEPCLQKWENGSTLCNLSHSGINKNGIKCCQGCSIATLITESAGNERLGEKQV